MTRQPKSVLTLLFLVFAMIPLPATSQDQENANEEVAEEENGVTDYISMDPAFVTHVGAPGNKPTYLKAAVSLRAGNASTRPAVEAHMPRLRHELVILFGEQTDTDRLTSMEGQEALREEARKRINAVLEEQQTGERIAGVLFTEFVVQK
ncbi:flagellar basal body-associated FliL family protein [Marinobacter sp.]|uniref:flagellar basal body-associated FliL family protein n=1 Tax=Marinobacter sp. TaxID=50741 RepID=UPI003566E80D